MTLPTYTLPRVYLPTETLGSIYTEGGALVCKTMELPWRNNEKNISCIPEGRYIFEKQSPNPSRPYGYFRARAIPGRTINKGIRDKFGNPMSAILMHRITYVKDLQGCIGIGGRFQDLNSDGVPDMVESSKTLQHMYETFPDVFELIITKKQ